MNDPQHTTNPDAPAPAPAAGEPLFSPRVFARQLRVDALMRGVILTAVLIAAAGIFFFEAGNDVWTAGAVLGVLGVWIWISSVSAKVSRALPPITAATELEPQVAEAMIEENLRRRPLLRWVRLMVYHRLAVLRHRQGRYDQSAAICQAVLAQPMGPAAQVRPHLLLMLVEARLHFGDVVNAYPPLAELYMTRLNLVESLQRLALQTRYEVMAGHHEAVLHHAEQKIELAELMPAPQCGAMHALMTVAAEAMQRHDLARWLNARAELLCSPEQIERVRRSI